MAARFLARAPRTTVELERHLTALGYQPATAAATVVRCCDLGWVDDEGLARDRAAQLRARGAGSAKITADLEARGLPAALVDAAVEAARDGASEREWARRALERAGVAEPRRAWRLLAGRGFPEEVIADLLGEPG